MAKKPSEKARRKRVKSLLKPLRVTNGKSVGTEKEKELRSRDEGASSRGPAEGAVTDMLAAGVVFLGTHLLSFGVAGFARVNIAVVLIALGVAVLLLREYRRVTAAAAGQP